MWFRRFRFASSGVPAPSRVPGGFRDPAMLISDFTIFSRPHLHLIWWFCGEVPVLCGCSAHDYWLWWQGRLRYWFKQVEKYCRCCCRKVPNTHSILAVCMIMVKVSKMSQTAWLISLAVYVIVVDHSHRGEIPVLVGSVGHLHLVTLWCQVAVTSLNHLTVVTKLENKRDIEIKRSHADVMASMCNICYGLLVSSFCLFLS